MRPRQIISLQQTQPLVDIDRIWPYLTVFRILESLPAVIQTFDIFGHFGAELWQGKKLSILDKQPYRKEILLKKSTASIHVKPDTETDRTQFLKFSVAKCGPFLKLNSIQMESIIESLCIPFSWQITYPSEREQFVPNARKLSWKVPPVMDA